MSDESDKVKNNLATAAKQARKKVQMIDALETNLGIVHPSCKQVGIARQTHYRWMKEDAEYKQACLEADEVALDFVESKLLSQIKKDVPSSTIFYMKTKGKKRGYVESIEIASFEQIKPPSWFRDEETA